MSKTMTPEQWQGWYNSNDGQKHRDSWTSGVNLTKTPSYTTDVSHFDAALLQYAKQISNVYTEVVKQTVIETSKKVKDAIDVYAPYKTGDYFGHFALKTSYEDTRNLRRTWYVRDPEYRLTHLLEDGHVVHVYPYGNKKAGLRYYGKSRAIRHIEYGEQIASRLPEFIENAMSEVKL